jgi:hypothetical protein
MYKWGDLKQEREETQQALPKGSVDFAMTEERERKAVHGGVGLEEGKMQVWTIRRCRGTKR